MCFFVISIFLYACESWTLTAELEKRKQAFEMRCYRRLLNISYKDHVTNEEVHRKTFWFSKYSPTGHSERKIKRGRQKRREDNIKEWTGMDFASSARAAENGTRWKGIVGNSSVVLLRPSKVMG